MEDTQRGQDTLCVLTSALFSPCLLTVDLHARRRCSMALTRAIELNMLGERQQALVRASTQRVGATVQPLDVYGF